MLLAWSRTSSADILPPGPVPDTLLISTPSCLASFLVEGAAGTGVFSSPGFSALVIGIILSIFSSLFLTSLSAVSPAVESGSFSLSADGGCVSSLSFFSDLCNWDYIVYFFITFLN